MFWSALSSELSQYSDAAVAGGPLLRPAPLAATAACEFHFFAFRFAKAFADRLLFIFVAMHKG